jgi:hypothetical protein
MNISHPMAAFGKERAKRTPEIAARATLIAERKAGEE